MRTAKNLEWSREDTTGVMIMNVTCVTICPTLYILRFPLPTGTRFNHSTVI